MLFSVYYYLLIFKYTFVRYYGFIAYGSKSFGSSLYFIYVFLLVKSRLFSMLPLSGSSSYLYLDFNSPKSLASSSISSLVILNIKL